MSEKALRDAVRDIDAEYMSHQEHVLSGAPATYDAYRFSCGKMEGLIRARAILIDLLKQLENMDE